MDPNMENYFRMQQSGGYKIPFYMAYPMQDVYLSEIEYERDRERLKEMYPKEAKRIQRVVEEECDKMEYDGSLMFDEYPDRVMVQKLCDDIYNKGLRQHHSGSRDGTIQRPQAGRRLSATTATAAAQGPGWTRSDRNPLI